MRAAPDIEYATKGDTSIAYRVVGNGPVDIVFSAGIVCHLELLRGDPHCDAFVRRLARVGRLILFDKPGTGMSDPLTEPPTLADRAEDYRAVMDAAGVRRAVVIGYSEAGGPGAVFAAMHPERTEALVLLSPVTRGWCDDEYLPELYDYYEGYVWRQLWHSHDHWADGSLVRALSPFVRHSPVYSRLAPTVERTCASPRMVRLIIQGARAYNALPALAALRVPTLVVNRTEEFVPREIAVDAAARVAGAQLALLPGDEHLCYFNGDDVVDAIGRFVAGTGVSSSPRVERALLTMLFTDVVDSTRQAARLGDEKWRSVLAQLDEAASDIVAGLGGRVVKQLGDGLLAVFDRPALALDAAAALHEVADEAGVQLRAGVHTGECELIGTDVAGIAVHIAARVSALAGPGQTLATATVRALVLGGEATWAEHGDYQLKGVPGTWQLVRLEGSGERPSALRAHETLGALRPHQRALLLASSRTPVATRSALRALTRLRPPRQRNGADGAPRTVTTDDSP